MVPGLARVTRLVPDAATRATLPGSFQRVVFARPGAGAIPSLLAGFQTEYVDLSEQNVASALLASGAIPYLFEGVSDVPGGPRGAYWDGGIIDYHFDLQALGQIARVIEQPGHLVVDARGQPEDLAQLLG